MKKLLAVAMILASALTCAYQLGWIPATASAAPAKNLKVYPKNTDKKALKADMKVISKALGVQCDFCHDMSAMEKDTKHKKLAREMMRMTIDINKKMKKSGFKTEVSCMTCHRGQKAPAE